MDTLPGLTANPVQDRIQSAVESLVASGREAAVQVAAYHRGRLVVDAVAGLADSGTGRAALASTPFFSYSTGKALTATVVHVLAERGELDYDLRIADVWPEYARHGKESTTLRHALTHTAGVPHLPEDTTPEDFVDWDRMCAVLADTRPLWTPGSRNGYHAWTFGWLIGETVRRATGRTLREALTQEVTGPLGIADEVFLAVPEAHLDRLAVLEERDWSDALDLMAAMVPHLRQVVPPKVRTDAALANRRDILTADLPAMGTMSARGLARMYSALLDGTLISPERLALVSTAATDGPDWVFGVDSPKTLGYALDAGMVGWSGMGGSIAGMAPELGLALAITKNALAYGGEDDPMEELRSQLVAAARDGEFDSLN
ncbi:serine hydrolase domain-containing protein [Hamadaea tsunoensis]|uniref:serine hydrolase domain-containing protein n=1 Tax=Hamadaea tsunoensis TaxID=53368 RepID=UPI000417EA8C|nr:serine hydrolase domain-containing protein [Hamadaea tsunoensis]